MTTRERQRDILETRALRARFDQAEKEGRLKELEVELGLRAVPVVDPMVQTARELLASGQPERFFQMSTDLDAKQRYELVSLLTNKERDIYLTALEIADREVSRG